MYMEKLGKRAKNFPKGLLNVKLKLQAMSEVPGEGNEKKRKETNKGKERHMKPCDIRLMFKGV